jgi:small-conductance mechanosensitive channel
MDAPETVVCLNCGRPLPGPYRPSCGQRRRDTDPTLREFLHESTTELTQWDGRIPSTLRALFLRPGILTQDFLAGRRARWLQPLRLCLICSLAFFLSKPVGETISRRSGRQIATITITNPDGSRTLTPEVLEDIKAGWPARVFGRDRLVRAALDNEHLNREVDAVLPKALFILLPIFAVLTMLAWLRRLPRYPAHLYMALQMHSAWFGALAVLTIVQAFFTSEAIVGLLATVALVYVVAYSLLAARRVFGDSWAKTFAKAVLVTVTYFTCVFVMTLAMLGYVLTRI